MRYLVVFITCSNTKEADKIAQTLLKLKLTACANLIPEIKSVYWWQGKIENSSETMMILKTKTSLLSKLIKEVKKLHSYSVPEIIALPITKGNPDYLKWINESVRA
ncbi:MAG: hypothetical protein A2252_08465 [Elusimicrobia bacterium RIFOXYA2_FULL_39_19]|nr:MAG: hypothetical protein A2252_08465 [Elusimicrobia bacterium RIFOXYA2_FULL_39_19]